MDYKVVINKIETTDGEMYIAECPTLHGVAGGGVTASEALEVLELEINEMLDFMRDEGEVIPPPDILKDKKEYSGRVTYRPGKQLHAEIDQYAQENEISLNTVITTAVSRFLGSVVNNDIIEKLADNIKKLDSTLHWHSEDLMNVRKYSRREDSPKQWSEIPSKTSSIYQKNH